MFGRDLVEQIHADARGQDDRNIPVIVEKCIDAVETWGKHDSLFKHLSLTFFSHGL